ncbi:MAG: hypothetical protein RJA61_693 [Candidatus Parcubacteria bacterium]|jgi:hypothetical protein
MNENPLWYDVHRTYFKSHIKRITYRMDTTYKTKNSGFKVIIGILIVALIALLFWKFKGDEIAPVETSGNNETVTEPVTTRKKYIDGTYSSTGIYTSPAGTEEIFVTLVIKNDTVSSGTFEGKATHPTSKKLQGQFSEGFSQAVVGKSIDSLSLTVVNGSSLTPKGFMDALSKIKTQALETAVQS